MGKKGLTVTHRENNQFLCYKPVLSEGAKELHKNFLKLVKNDDSWKSRKFKFDKNFGKTPLEPKEFNYPLPFAVKDEEIDGFLDNSPLNLKIFQCFS